MKKHHETVTTLEHRIGCKLSLWVPGMCSPIRIDHFIVAHTVVFLALILLIFIILILETKSPFIIISDSKNNISNLHLSAYTCS